MKIAVSSTAPNLEANVDPRFGRCAYFVVVDPATMEFTSLENASAMAGGGAGIATAQTLIGQGVNTVITGNCGPNAYQTLSAAGIKVITEVSGKIKTAIDNYQSGKLQPNSQPNVGGHFGTGGGMGRSGGGGMGRGGGGMGRGGGMRGGGGGIRNAGAEWNKNN